MFTSDEGLGDFNFSLHYIYFKFVLVSSSNVLLGSFASVIISTFLQEYTVKFIIINESVL